MWLTYLSAEAIKTDAELKFDSIIKLTFSGHTEAIRF